MATLEYKVFKKRHPCWLGPYWEILEHHAKAGGQAMKSDSFMRECLRRNLSETDAIWEERRARAVLKPYAGEILGSLVATVFGDPLKVLVEAGDDEEAEGEPQPPPPDWEEWLEDVSRPGTADPVTFAKHMRCVLERVLVDGVAYTQADFMRPEPGAEPVNRAQAEAMDLAWPYLCEVDPSCVIDWEDDDAGDLLWALIRGVEARRMTLTDDRRMVTERFRFLTREKWQVWSITYDREKYPDGPLDQAPVTLDDQGPHSFGRVPLVRHRAPDGLWAMDRMFPLLNDILRGSSGYSWIRDKTNCPTPWLSVQNLKDGEQTADVVESMGVGRQKGAPTRVGEIAIIAERDEMGWSAPGTESLMEAREGNRAAVSELYRCMDAIAQAIDPSAASNKQSGESKAMDATSKAVLARKLGEWLTKDAAPSVLQMVTMGMGAEPLDWAISGCDEVEIETAAMAVADLGALELVTLPPGVRVLELRRFMRLRGYTDQQIEQATKEMGEQLASDAAAEQASAAATKAMADETARDPKAAMKPQKPKPTK